MSVHYMYAWYLKRSEDGIRFLELELPVIWVLEIKHRTSGRAPSGLNPCTISLAP